MKTSRIRWCAVLTAPLLILTLRGVRSCMSLGLPNEAFGGEGCRREGELKILLLDVTGPFPKRSEGAWLFPRPP